MENIEFEEKVDIDDLILPSEQMKMGDIVINEIFKVDQRKESQYCDLEFDNKLKMEEKILKLFEELDMDKSNCSTNNFFQIRLFKIRHFVHKMSCTKITDANISSEIVSLKARIVEITDKHKLAMSLHAKNLNSILTMHKKELDDKTKEITTIKKELECVRVTNDELRLKVENLQMCKSTEIKRNCEIKPFVCKYCSRAFAQVLEVKEHIKIHFDTAHQYYKDIKDMKASQTANENNKDESAVEISERINSEEHLKSLNNAEKKYELGKVKKELHEYKATNLALSKKIKEFNLLENPASKNKLRKPRLLNSLPECEEKKYSCSICSTKFSQKQTMVRHVESIHEGNWKICHSCIKKFGTPKASQAIF